MGKNREQLLYEIAELFFEKGYERTSVRDIGRAIKLSNSGLYYHFENKQEMLFCIIDDFMAKILSNLQENLSLIQRLEDKVLYIIQSHIRFFVKYPAQTKVVIYEAHSLEDKYAERLKIKQLTYRNTVKEILAEVIRASRTTIDVNVATFCLLGMLNWVVQWYKPDGRVPPELLARNIWKCFLYGLKAPPLDSDSLTSDLALENTDS